MDDGRPERKDQRAEDWSQALGTRRREPTRETFFDIFLAAAVFALISLTVWAHVDSALEALPYFRAYASAHAAMNLPIPVSIGLAFPSFIAPIPSVLLMIMLGALFPRRWSTAGFFGTLVHVLAATIFMQFMLLGTRSGSKIEWGHIFWIVTSPIVLYPIATCYGARWIQVRPHAFWRHYSIAAAAFCVGIVVYGIFADKDSAYGQTVQMMQKGNSGRSEH